MKKTFWVVLFCLTIQLYGYAQADIADDPFIKFSHLTKKQGLSANAIFDFIEDRENYIWIATSNGLNRYNGYEIKRFHHQAFDSLSISDNMVTCLAVLNDSMLMAGTKNGLNFINTSRLTFTRSLSNFNQLKNLENKHIRALLADGDWVWAETADGELIKIDFAKTEINVYKHRPPTMVNIYNYHSICKTPGGKLLVGGRYMGLYMFDPATEQFHEFKTQANHAQKKRDEDAAVFFIDSFGNYWVGGIDGLYTFDPETEIFHKKLSISSFSIIEPKPGELWIGTGSGLFRYDAEHNLFIHSKHNDNILHSLTHNHINKIYADRSGNIWLGTLDGISIFQPARNKFKHIFHIPENENSPASNHISAIAEDPYNRIWLGTENSGLDVFDTFWNRLYTYSMDRPETYKLVSNPVSALMVDNENDVWVGQWSGRGFNIVNPEKNKNLSYSLLYNELKADWYNDFLMDSQGQYWIGIWGAQGLYRFDKDNGVFMNNRYIETTNLLRSPIHSMAFDGSLIWLAVKAQNRFYCFDPLNEKTSFYSLNHYHPFNFVKIDSIANIDNNIYFFTEQGTYLKSGKKSFKFELGIPPAKKKRKSDSLINKTSIARELNAKVYDLVRNKDGTAWVATNKGLYKTVGNLPMARYHVNDGHSNGLPSDTIYSLIFQNPGTLWLGTHKGLARFSTDEKTFKSYQTEEPKYLSSHLVQFVFEDSHGNLWIGTTNNGVNRMNKSTGTIDQYPGNINNRDAFWGASASCITEDRQGNIWIGGMGINKFNPHQNSFTHVTVANGLADNQVMAILCDDFGRLWVSTTNGLSCYNPNDSTCINFYDKDGLQDNEFSGAACKLQNGNLLFGGKNGLNIIDPSHIPFNTHPPAVKITGFSVFDQPLPNLLNAKSIKLKYNQNYFSFAFAALDFSNPEQNQYKYMLENFDDHWIVASAQNRNARYTNVDPGKYTFRVIASNNDGVWNQTGISIPLIIRPPFWRTRVFYVFIILLIALIIVAWVKYREKQIKDQNRFLVLEQKLLRSQMNPHFIFNSLSSIQSFIFENNPVVAGTYLSRFAELIRAILYNSREEFITLEKEIKTLQNYLELQQLRYQNTFKYQLTVDPEIEPEIVNIPPMLAQPFIENAIEHGLKDLDYEGLLKIDFKLHFNTLHIKVEDNGVGIEKAKSLHNPKAREHQSLATIITNERIEILNKGRKSQPYTLAIHDLKNIRENASGTLVEFVIPVDRQ